MLLSSFLLIVVHLFGWFRIPESRGRTFEELDILFERKVPARKFKNYDLLAEHHEESGPESPVNV